MVALGFRFSGLEWIGLGFGLCVGCFGVGLLLFVYCELFDLWLGLFRCCLIGLVFGGLGFGLWFGLWFWF